MRGLTPKQEAFSQAVAKGMNQSEAYRQVYAPKRMKAEGIHREAHRLMSNPKIATRVAALRREIVQDLKYEVADAMREAEDAMCLADRQGQAGAYVAAVALRAKLMGLLIEEHEHRVSPLSEESTEALLALKALLEDEQMMSLPPPPTGTRGKQEVSHAD